MAELDPKIKGMTKVVPKHNQSVTELNPKVEGAWLPLVALS